MSRSLTDVGPAVLVPAAWTVTLGAVTTPLVSRRTLFIALCVMSVLLAAFAVGARDLMTGPVLGVWQGVLVVGFLFTFAGVLDMALTPASDPVLPVTLYGWMVVPGLAYVATAQSVPKPYSTVYLAGSILSLAGAGTFALAGSTVDAGVGIAVVGIGQTAGIVAAVLQNPGTAGAD